MFGITTHQELPDEYITSYAKWDTYMAGVWAALRINLHVDREMTIIEIAPGTSTKIGLALKKFNFCGKLYVVEPEKASLLMTCNNYRTLLPDANIYPINHSLVNSIDLLPKQADFILSNHPLDDMLMAIPFDDKHPASLFKWALKPSNELSPLFLQHGLRVTCDLNHLHSAKEQIIQQWEKIFNELQPTTTIISQYPSIVLEQNHLQALNQQASDILRQLKKECTNRDDEAVYQKSQSMLNQLENYNNNYIGAEILNIKNWFVYTLHR